jgi:hypothetical protein
MIEQCLLNKNENTIQKFSTAKQGPSKIFTLNLLIPTPLWDSFSSLLSLHLGQQPT